MPLSEFYRMVNGKIESAQQKSTTCSDISFLPDNEFVELVWENGQIMMQGQTSKVKKGPVSSNFQFHTPKIRDKDVGNANISKTGKFGAFESSFNDVAIPVPSVEMGLNQDDDMVPWLNYHVDDYCSELIPELSGVTVNEPSTRNCSNQTFRDSHHIGARNGVNSQQGNASKLSSSRTGELYPWSIHQGQASMPSLGSGVSDLISSNTGHSHHPVCGDSGQGQASVGGFSCTKMQKQDSGVPICSNSSFLNFSHFLRPAATARANPQSIVDAGPSGSSGVDRMENKDKSFAVTSSNPAKSMFIGPNGGLQKETGFHSQSNLVSAKVDSNPLMKKPLEESRLAEQCEAVCREDTVKNDKSPNQALGGSTYKGMQENEKAVEPVVASSSVCSGNSAERASNDPTNNLKRKSRDTEDSEWQSEDVDEELVGVKRTTARGGTGSKRSRAAEVHNLSERRRRDRINEKMRALQELIPNCNKVDKASMLDEAIEYLKTLQLQVQIMSMGAGLYMPPMMFPPGMQHMHAAHMPHFSPMGVGMGMGMGMGFGMGMLDLNGGSRGCPMIPMPSMQGAHYPSPPGPANFHGVPGSNHQVYGHPGSPMVPLPARPLINSSAGLNGLRMGVHAEVSSAAPNSNTKDLIQNTNSQAIHNADPSRSMNQTSSQFQATHEGFDRSKLLQKNDLAPDVGGGAAVKSSNANETVPNRAAGSD